MLNLLWRIQNYCSVKFHGIVGQFLHKGCIEFWLTPYITVEDATGNHILSRGVKGSGSPVGQFNIFINVLSLVLVIPRQAVGIGGDAYCTVSQAWYRSETMSQFTADR